MKKTIPVLIPIVATGLALFLGLTYYGATKWLVVGEIQLEMPEEPAWEGSREEIYTSYLKKLQKFIGQKMWTLNFEELNKILQSDSRVGSIKILRLLPSRVFIEIEPRKPLLIFLNPDTGQIHPISMQGQILPHLAFNRIPDLPVLRGSIFLKQPKMRKLAIEVLNIMPEEGNFSRQKISEIKFSPPEKSLLLVLSKNGEAIKVGNDPAQIKTKRIESVLKYLDQKNIKWRVIDARFSQKIVVSTTKAI